MEIAPGIHQITCTFGAGRMVFVYLLVGDECALLVDTGCAAHPDSTILPYMDAHGIDRASVRYVLITHSDLDHQGGNGPLKRAIPSALLACHRFDEPWIADAEALIAGRYSQFERDHGIGYGDAGKDGIRADLDCCPVDLTLLGGETFRLGRDWSVEAIHTPGHTWGHTAVYDPRSRTLISGEAALSTHIPRADWSPAMPPTYCYVDTYLTTQDRLLSMEIDLLASAHWPLQRGADVRAFVQGSREYALQVERALLDRARRGAFTLRQAVDELGPTLGGWPREASAEFTYGMSGNLHGLTQRGQLVTTRDAAGHIVWGLP